MKEGVELGSYLKLALPNFIEGEVVSLGMDMVKIHNSSNISPIWTVRLPDIYYFLMWVGSVRRTKKAFLQIFFKDWFIYFLNTGFLTWL